MLFEVKIKHNLQGLTLSRKHPSLRCETSVVAVFAARIPSRRRGPNQHSRVLLLLLYRFALARYAAAAAAEPLTSEKEQ